MVFDGTICVAGRLIMLHINATGLTGFSMRSTSMISSNRWSLYSGLSVTSASGIIGGPIGGWLSDKLGRKFFMQMTISCCNNYNGSFSFNRLVLIALIDTSSGFLGCLASMATSASATSFRLFNKKILLDFPSFSTILFKPHMIVTHGPA